MPLRKAGGSGAPDAQMLEDRLREGLAQLAIAATDGQVAHSIDFLGLLQKWNATYNLTSVRDPKDMLAVHLLDSLSILPLLDQLAPATVLDVGSGAGLPAIPLALFRPTISFETVDAVAKKIGFQLQVRTALGLPNLFPHHARIEAFAMTRRPSLIVSRAYTALPTMLASIDHLAVAETTIVAMKGSEPVAEIAAIGTSWNVTRVVPLDVPFLGARRCAVVLRRSA